MLSSDFLFPRFFVANPSNFSHCKCFSSRIDTHVRLKLLCFNAGVTIRESIRTYKDLRAASVQLVSTSAVINCALLVQLLVSGVLLTLYTTIAYYKLMVAGLPLNW